MGFFESSAGTGLRPTALSAGPHFSGGQKCFQGRLTGRFNGTWLPISPFKRSKKCVDAPQIDDKNSIEQVADARAF